MSDATFWLICGGMVVLTIGICVGMWIGSNIAGNAVRQVYREAVFSLIVPLVNRAREHADHDDALAADFRKLDEVAWLKEATGL